MQNKLLKRKAHPRSYDSGTKLETFPNELLCNIATGLFYIKEFALCEVAIQQIDTHFTQTYSCMAKLFCSKGLKEGINL